MQHDPILVEAARQDDIEAVQRLLIVCRSDLRRIAHTQCAAGVDAEDAVPESMLLIYRRIRALRAGAAFPAWALSIVQRECHRLWRSMRGEVELPAADPYRTSGAAPGSGRRDPVAAREVSRGHHPARFRGVFD